MRKLNQLPVPQDTDLAKFPSGTIQNQTDLVEGTPVVREIYGDVLTNLYKLLDITGETATGTEDSETSQYQIIDALKKFANELNDLQQVVSLVGSTWTVNFNIDLLPDNYVFVGKVSDNYVSGTSYTFEGTGVNSYGMVSDTGFNASDVVLIVIDQSQVKFINLTYITGENTINTPFGAPISYNEGNTVHYLSDGKIVTDNPSIDDIQQTIRVDESNSNLNLIDCIIFKSHVLCLVLDTSTVTYAFYQFDLGTYTGVFPVILTGFSFPVGVDNQPYMYCDGVNVYLSNNSGNSVNDYDFHKLNYNPDDVELIFISSFSLDAAFEKTTNSFITGEFLFTFIAGQLNKYNFSTGIKTEVGTYNTNNGVVFKQNGNTYYTNGDTAVKWNI